MTADRGIVAIKLSDAPYTLVIKLTLLPAVVLYSAIPDSWRGPVDIPCLFTVVFGVHCPGCGLKRSIIKLLAGDLNGSIAINPLGPLALACITFVFAEEAKNIFRGWERLNGRV